MSSDQKLRPRLDAYPDDPRRVPDEELERGIKELERLSLAVQAKKLRWVAEAERRAVFRRDGYVSSTDWLSDRLNLSRGAAKEQLKNGTGPPSSSRSQGGDGQGRRIEFFRPGADRGVGVSSRGV